MPAKKPAKTGGRGKQIMVTVSEATFRGLQKLSQLEGGGSNPTVLSKEAVTNSVRKAVEIGLIKPEDLQEPQEEDSPEYAELLEKYRVLCGFFKLLFETYQTDGYSRAEIADLIGVDPATFEKGVQRIQNGSGNKPTSQRGKAK